jgi:hypothetical protein
MARTLKVEAKILADTSAYIAGLRRAMRSTDQFGRKAKRTGRSNVFSGVTKSVVGLAGAYIGAEGLITVLRGAVREQQESIKVSRQTAAVLKSTKGAAGLTAREIENLSRALSEKTAIDDEAIQSAQNLLLTFTNIGRDVFPTATQAVLDLSVATGTSLKGASIQVGKALQDPIRGITALRRVGVNFSEDQQAVIKRLVETGKSADAQKMILKELAIEFGGSAAAQATPLDRLRMTYNNLLEDLGAIVVPALEDAAKAAMEFVDEFKRGVGPGGEFRDALDGIRKVLEPIGRLLADHPALLVGAAAAWVSFQTTVKAVSLFNAIMASIGSVSAYVKAGAVRGVGFGAALQAGIVVGLFALPVALALLIAEGLRLAGAKFKEWYSRNIGPELQRLLGLDLISSNPLAGFGPWFEDLKAMAKRTWDFIKGVFGGNVFSVNPFGSIGQWFDWLKKTAKDVWKFIKGLYSGGSGGPFGTIKAPKISGLSGIITAIKRTMDNAVKAVSGVAGRMASAGATVAVRLVAGVRSRASGVVSAIGSALSKAVSAARQKVGAMASAGASIAQGLARGVSNAAGQVIAAARRLADSLPKWVRKVLGISSPSRVFMTIGEQIVEGMARGMAKTGPVVAAARNLGKTASSSASQEFGVSSEIRLLEAQRRLSRIQRRPAKTKAEKKEKKRDEARAKAEVSRIERQMAIAAAKKAIKDSIDAIIEKIKESRLAQIMAPINEARDKRAEATYAKSKKALEDQIRAAEEEQRNGAAQARYQSKRAALEARLAAARRSGNLDLVDTIQAELDALDARYGPEYLANLRDQLAQLNEDETERTAEKEAEKFAEAFRAGLDEAFANLLNSPNVQAFFTALKNALAGSGVSPSSLGDVTAGTGTAAGTVAGVNLPDMIRRFLTGKKKGTYKASAIADWIGGNVTKGQVYAARGAAPKGYKIQNRLSGGRLAPLTLVGEGGPELIVGGATGTVLSGTKTNQYSPNITINAYGATADNPQMLAREIAWQLATR